MARAQALRWRVAGTEPRELGRDQIRKDLDCPFQGGLDPVATENY